jgi:hypothetical protein
MVLAAFKASTAPVRGAAIKRTGELMVFCPWCKSFDTVWFDDGTLMSPRKFRQEGDRVYHDCGSDRPCRLYRNS